jgi:hypothetical protein
MAIPTACGVHRLTGLLQRFSLGCREQHAQLHQLHT